jgi:hypothetical protein
MPQTDDIVAVHKALSDSLGLVFDAISVVGKALLNNPSKEEKRKLNIRLARLEAERAEIAAKMDAIEDGETAVRGPTPTQVNRIAVLTGEAEAMTAANTTVSSAMALTAKVLTLATKIAEV